MRTPCGSPSRLCSTRPRTTSRPAAPSVYRRIFPILLAVTATGADEVPEAEVEAAATAVLEERG